MSDTLSIDEQTLQFAAACFLRVSACLSATALTWHEVELRHLGPGGQLLSQYLDAVVAARAALADAAEHGSRAVLALAEHSDGLDHRFAAMLHDVLAGTPLP